VPKAKTTTRATPKAARLSAARKAPKLLAGGNPQIPKGDGDAPVRAYIAAMPGWKRAVWKRLDALIGRTVPELRRAVKYNSPLYGLDGQTWFLSCHCFDAYIKVAFHRGARLTPKPPGTSKQAHVRYLDIREHDTVDEEQFADWVRQASELPGEKL
jgi:hypothetical protein